MKIPKEIIIKVKKGVAGAFMACSALTSLLMIILFINTYKTDKDTIALSFLFIIIISMVFLTYKIYRFYMNAGSSKDVTLFKKTQKSPPPLSDKEKEHLIQEKIREQALKADQENKKQHEIKQSAAANLDALESVTDLSREDLEKMEHNIRRTFNKNTPKP